MPPEQRRADDALRLRKLGPVILPRLRKEEADRERRMMELARIPPRKRTAEQRRELAGASAQWLMKEAGVFGNPEEMYGQPKPKRRQG